MLCLILFSCLMIKGVECKSREKKWQYTVVPYVWLFGQKGTLNIKDIPPIEINVTPWDVLKNLNIIDFIFQLHLEAEKRPLAYMADLTYLKSSPNKFMTNQLSFLNFGVYYTIFYNRIRNAFSLTSFELLAGGRNIYYGTSVNLLQKSLKKNSKKKNSNWISPLIGARLIVQLSKATSLLLRASIAKSRSSFSWDTQAAMTFSLKSHVSLAFGYRTFHVDVKRNQFYVNNTYYGPVLGFKITW